jgi:hypothetical protein
MHLKGRMGGRGGVYIVQYYVPAVNMHECVLYIRIHVYVVYQYMHTVHMRV